MDGWRTKGVKSRLQVSTVTEASRNRAITTNLAEFIELAGGAVGDYDYTRDLPYRPVLIHATHDKAHSLNGYLRYTADGTPSRKPAAWASGSTRTARGAARAGSARSRTTIDRIHVRDGDSRA